MSSSEAPREPYYLATRDDVPLQSGFKPAMTVLSRKSAPKIASRKNLAPGMEQFTANDDDEDEEDETKKVTLTMEERQLKAQREREEKQKKYEEVRGRLFGTSVSASGNTSPRNATSSTGKLPANTKAQNQGRNTKDSRPSSSAGNSNRLFDPNENSKPGPGCIQKNGTPTSGSGNATPIEEQTLRAPKGPDGSGRGGFGFTPRGGKMIA